MAAKMPAPSFVVEIVNGQGEFVGMGILVSADRVLTCAHVINIALGRPPDDSRKPPDDTLIRVQFPFREGAEGKGAVLRWHEPKNGLQEVRDCCVLALRAALIDEIRTAKFEEARPGTKFRFSIRTGPDSLRVWRFGTIGEPTSVGLYQVQGQPGHLDEFITPGCSGSPAISTRSQRVLGMIVWGNVQENGGHIIPTQTLKGPFLLDIGGMIARRMILAATSTALAGALGAYWIYTRPLQIKLGIKQWIGYTPFAVAKQLRLFPSNINVVFKNVEMASQLPAHLANGTYDIVCWTTADHVKATFENWLSSIKEPARPVAILKVDTSRGADGIIVRQGINSEIGRASCRERV